MKFLDVVIDTDPGCDDAMALLLALLSDNIRVRCITLTYGNTSLDNCRRNLELTLHVAHANHVHLHHPAVWNKVRVALGADRPLIHPPEYAHFYHGDDGLGNVHDTLATTDRFPTEELYGRNDVVLEYSERDAVDELLWQVEQHTGRLAIVALGPLTNVALAWQRNAPLMATKSIIYSMGGAISMPGNVTPVAEFNVWTDPHAAAIVYDATSHAEHPLEVVLFPTNSTGQPVVYGPDYAVLDGKTFLDCPVAYFTREIFQYTLRAAGDVLGQSSNHIHDAVVTHWLLDSLTHSEDELAQLGYVWKVMDVRIETEGTWTRGMCVVDERGYEPVDPDNLQQIHAGKNAWHGRRPNKLRCLMDLDAQRCTKRVLACLGVE